MLTDDNENNPTPKHKPNATYKLEFHPVAGVISTVTTCHATTFSPAKQRPLSPSPVSSPPHSDTTVNYSADSALKNHFC